MISIYVMKLKFKSKVFIVEFISVNVVFIDDVYIFFMYNFVNKDNILDNSLCVGISDIVVIIFFIVKKLKGELMFVKFFVDKRKMDVRKKSLKRL